MQPKINALKKIEYKLKKNWSGTPTDQQRVDMAQSLLDSVIGESDIVVDNQMPTSLFGATLTWSAGAANDAIVNISAGIVSEEHDLSDDPELIPFGSTPVEEVVTSWDTGTKIVAPDKETGDRFGYSVAISGDYVVAGAYSEDPDGVSSAGSAYIFYNDGTGWDTGTKIVAPDKEADDYFGTSVAISGDYVVVGACGEDPDDVDYAGSAYIFYNDGTGWDTGTKIANPDPGADDKFGTSVAISGDYVVVGAYSEDPDDISNAGSAYIFYNDGTGWDTGTKIVAPDKEASDYFGTSVAISGDYVVVGAYEEDPGVSSAGSAYIFNRTGLNTWDAGIKIVAPDKETGDRFGYSVAISGDYVVAGAYSEDPDDISNAGSAYIFYNDGTGWDTGTKIVAPDPEASDYFGRSVAISGDYVVVGAYYEDPDDISNAGSVYIFYNDGAGWDAGTKIANPDPGADDKFGTSVAISGDYVVAGAYFEDPDDVSNAGSAYIFKNA